MKLVALFVVLFAANSVFAYDIEAAHKLYQGCSYQDLLPIKGYLVVKGSMTVTSSPVIGDGGKVVRTNTETQIKGEIVSATKNIQREGQDGAQAIFSQEHGAEVMPLSFLSKEGNLYDAIMSKDCAHGTFLIQVEADGNAGNFVNGSTREGRCAGIGLVYSVPTLISATCDAN